MSVKVKFTPLRAEGSETTVSLRRDPATVAEVLEQAGYDRKHARYEINGAHAQRTDLVEDNDTLEIIQTNKV